MKHEMANFGDSPMVQHQAQLSVTAELFRITYGVRPRAYVLLINGVTQRAFELRSSVAGIGKNITRRISEWSMSNNFS